MRFNNAVETNVCPSRDEAATIGRISCSILNRLPFPIEEETWGQVSNNTGRTTQRRLINFNMAFVELVALLIWKQSFNLSNFHCDVHVADATVAVLLTGLYGFLTRILFYFALYQTVCARVILPLVLVFYYKEERGKIYAPRLAALSAQGRHCEDFITT